MSDALLWLYCVTPLHNGSGEALGSVDRPIIREITTGYPYVQSSTIKGALKGEANKADNYYEIVFGTQGASGENGRQGCVTFADAQLVLFPVRSLSGVFVWTTSTLALARLLRLVRYVRPADSNLTSALDGLLKTAISLAPGEALGTCDEQGVELDTAIRLHRKQNGESVPGDYCVEGLVLQPRHDVTQRKAMGALAGVLAPLIFPASQPMQEFFKARMLLLNDDTFARMLRHATPIEANIAIGPTGVTTDGSLRYTEYLPAESVLVGFATVTQKLADSGHACGILGYLKGLVKEANGVRGALQLGGDESKGKGIVEAHFMGGSATETMPEEQGDEPDET
jgi:CRISPR-associated protein Cmr4